MPPKRQQENDDEEKLQCTGIKLTGDRCTKRGRPKDANNQTFQCGIPHRRFMTAAPRSRNDCGFLRTKLDAMTEHTGPNIPTYQDIREAVDSVAYAIILLQGESHGFAILDHNEEFFIHTEQPWVHPWSLGEQRVALLYTEPSNESSRRVETRIFNPGFDLSLEASNRIHEDIRQRLGDWYPPNRLPDATNWNTGIPQGTTTQINNFYTIFNAWAILFTLQLNPAFTSTSDFLRDAQHIVGLAVLGLIDWETIIAFLKCYNYITAQDDPAEDRRFATTIPATALGKTFTQIRNAYDRARSSTSYRFSPNGGLGEGPRTNTGLPTLPVNTSSRPKTGNTAINLPQGSKTRNTSNNLPLGPKKQQSDRLAAEEERLINHACDEFHRRLDDLQKEENVKTWVAMNKDLRREVEGWRSWEEVQLAISAITAAISIEHLPSGGFCNPEAADIQAFLTQECPDREEDDVNFNASGAVAGKAPLPRLPMILACLYKSHIFIVIVQLEDGNRASITFLDSKPGQLSEKRRIDVYLFVSTLVRKIGWIREGFSTRLNTKFSWAFPIVQNDDHSCGYYTILNGWVVALGLHYSKTFRVPEKGSAKYKQFLGEIITMSELARGDYLDWKMMYAFLRCWDVVTDQLPPNERRFEGNGVLQLPDLEALNSYARDLRQNADPWDPPGYAYRFSFDQFAGNEESRLYHFDTREQDKMREVTTSRQTYQPNLLSKQLKSRFEEGELSRLRGSFDHNRNSNPSNQEVINQLFKAMKYRTELGTEDAEVDTNPCTYYDRCLAFLNSQLNQLKSKGIMRNLSGSWQLLSRNRRIAELTEVNRFLREEDMSYAIAAVIEAINEHGPPGFSLALPESAIFAVQIVPMHLRVENHRRCLFLPFIVGDDTLIARGVDPTDLPANPNRRAHYMLAVVQEERLESGNSSRFHVFFLDSNGNDRFTRHLGRLHGLIQEAVRKLGWSTSDNEDERVRFRDYTLIHAERQQYGFSCSYHVILNAWILALGLIPSASSVSLVNMQITEELRKLITLALDGHLDWKTLATFLICRKLVRETSVSSVPENRRFLHTQRQTNQDDMEARMDQRFQNNSSATVANWTNNIEVQHLFQAKIGTHVSPPRSSTSEGSGNGGSTQNSQTPGGQTLGGQASGGQAPTGQTTKSQTPKSQTLKSVRFKSPTSTPTPTSNNRPQHNNSDSDALGEQLRAKMQSRNSQSTGTDPDASTLAYPSQINPLQHHDPDIDALGEVLQVKMQSQNSQSTGTDPNASTPAHPDTLGEVLRAKMQSRNGQSTGTDPSQSDPPKDHDPSAPDFDLLSYLRASNEARRARSRNTGATGQS
ncbi:hypothetical protein B0J11DRAFT_602741 [Dendryphion nanum]|uniref:Ubiquitin-like protease family profile domain-containing protein n=1 Tax=Dendryphion nanum TaxID=256645 RepID=A0A9P9E1T7_9PLEO|nr:hypothetical protein B0J11DRAFT_602741 [Dendryphion nanum]